MTHAEHYCHHCLHWNKLVDGVYCAACLGFFTLNRRLPRKGESA